MTRVASGAVLIVLAVAAVWFAPPAWFLAVAELLVVLGCREYVDLARATKLDVSFVVPTIAAVLVCATFSLVVFDGVAAITDAEVLLAAVVAVAASSLFTWRSGIDGLASTAASAMPALYLGLPIGAMVAIRESRGPEALFLLMLTVSTSDIAQYYSGRAFGRTPLAPTISPKKTIEGAVGGFVFGGAMMAIVGAWWLPMMPVAGRAVLGVVTVAVGIAGDLFESMLKRSAGVKDSSALIPGHGGVLDRIDALLLAAPVYFIVLKHVVAR